MKALLRFYPRRWRARYGGELAQLIDDTRPATRRARLALGVDLLRGALDVHLHTERAMTTSTRAALRRGTLIAVLVSAALAVEIVLTNVVFPTRHDDDAVPVLLSYLGVFAALAFVGARAARVTTSRATVAVTGAVAGALIAVLVVAAFAFVDNVFLDTVSRQTTKIDGFARSGMSSMRAYINVGLLWTLLALTVGFAVTGAGLAAAGAVATGARPADPEPRAE